MKHQHKLVLDSKTEEASGRAWVQIASAGEFNGYAGGAQSFEFNKTVFDQIIANFRAHPSYLRGSDGLGREDVIAWDFSHASEMRPTEGSLPATGAPSQGWITELASRQGSDGQAELWALTRWLEPASTYVKEDRYKWASVSVVFDAVDARTGVVVGPLLTSVALTNSPFIEGMQPLIAASRNHHPSQTTQSSKKTDSAMTLIQKILSKLPTFEPHSPNRAIAVERACRFVVPGGQTMPRRILYERHVHPTLAALGVQRINAASRAGTLRQSLPSVSSGGRTPTAKVNAANLPLLDVSSQVGGRNLTERLMLFVRASMPHASNDQVFLRAMALKKSHKIVA